ncbi:MAG: hypothetical protein AAGD09_16735 [Cyanobacteria bacterium P01_F01_bin.56]
MATSNLPALSPGNQAALRSLMRTIELSQGEFSLILVRCNFHMLRNRVQADLKAQLSVPFQEVQLQPQTQSLYTAIRRTLGDSAPTTLLIHRLEIVGDIDTLLQIANQSREEFRNNLPCPLVIWVTEQILSRLIRDATDFESWASVTIEFESELADLTELIMHTAEDLFKQLLDSRENIFLDNRSLHLDQDSPLRAELRVACELIHQLLDPLPPEVEASCKFILGRITDNNTDEAKAHYERSAQLWQQVGNLEHYAHVQFYLGLWWGSHAVRHPQKQKIALQHAQEHLELALNTFEAIDQPGRVAQFINFLGEVRHRQGDWPALEELAHKAFTLHQQFCDYFRQARAQGFMAAVSNAHGNWTQTEFYAKQALDAWQTGVQFTNIKGDRAAFLDWERRFHRPWYLYYLGRAQRHSQNLHEATETLETARKMAKPSYDPDLYIDILNELREIYFERKDYRKAYKTRQYRREIQGRFNFRPFVGPGRLQAGQDVTNPSLPHVTPKERIAPEMETSGRQADIDELIYRIERKDYRLSVVYGPSGVGKSSTIQAGLIPALQQRTFDGRRVITILQQVYKNWAAELGSQLLQACSEAQPDWELPNTLDTLPAILEQLRDNERNKFKTILIFDQFEEFFFANTTVEERMRFYNFAVDCFKILDVEVILSVKEDYLHFLLACNRLSGLEIISNNILDRKILYYIGNFSQEDAANIFRNRIQDTRTTFDEDLIEQLVNDLADSFGYVRPIELQIVGAQLQSDKITQLRQYQSLARDSAQPREILVNKYLETVVDDCGPENQELAEIILYLLTNEDGTRPIRTKTELMREQLCEAVRNHEEQVDVILEIFVKSGLVLLVPSAPTDSYQLVHDYLVSLIRDKVQTKYQEEIAQLTQKVVGLSKIVRLLIGLSTFLVSAIVILYLISRNNNLLYKVTELDRSSIKILSQFEGYQLNSLEGAIANAHNFNEPAPLSFKRDILPQRTTLPIHTLQYVLDNIAELHWQNTEQGQIFAADVHTETGRVATGGLDQTVKIWDFNGQEQLTVNLSLELDDDAQIWDVRFTGAGDRLAVIDSNGQLLLWPLVDSATEPELRQQAHPYPQPDQPKELLTRLIASPDQSTLATAGADGMIRLWDANNLSMIAEWPVSEVPDQKVLIGSLEFSSNGESLVAADDAGNISIWQLQDNAPGELLDRLPIAHAEERLSTWALAVSPDNRLLAAASSDGFIRIWDFFSGQPQQKFLAHNGNLVATVDFITTVNSISPEEDMYWMVTTDELGTVRSWRTDTEKSIQIRELKGNQGWIWNLLHTPLTDSHDSKLITTSIDGSMRFWDLSRAFNRDDDSRQNANSLALPEGHINSRTGNGQTWSTSYSPDRQLLATSGNDGTAKIWQLSDFNVGTESPKLLFELQHRNDAQSFEQDIFWVAFSPSGEKVVTAGADGTVKLWDSETGQPLTRQTAVGDEEPIIMAHPDRASVNTVAFSPDGQLVASADALGRLWLWQADDGQPITDDFEPIQVSGSDNKPWTAAAVFAVQFSPEGDYIATASADGDVRLWELQSTGDSRSLSAEPAAVLPGHRDGATSVDFSGDGLIATAGKDGVVRIWDWHTALRQTEKQSEPKPIQTLLDYEQRVTWVEFYQADDAPAELLATASKDGSVIVWERNHEGWGFRSPGRVFKQKYEFIGHDDGAFSSTFLAEGQQIAVAQGNGQIKLWQLEDTDELIVRACEWIEPGKSATEAEPSKASTISRIWQQMPWVKSDPPEVADVCGKYKSASSQS